MSKLWSAGVASDILYRKDLTNSQKLLIGIISGFLQNTGSCFISNQALAEVLQVDKTTISRMISDLQAKGIFEIDIDSAKGNKRFISFRKKLLTDDVNDTPPIDPQINTLLISRSIPIDPQINISNNLNNNLNSLSIKESKFKHLEKYFDLTTENPSGRFKLKNYQFIHLTYIELENLFKLYKRHNFNQEEIKEIFFAGNAELEQKQKDIKFKGGLSYKYLSNHILESHLRIKKESNLVNKTSSKEIRSNIPNAQQTKEKVSRLNNFNESNLLNKIKVKIE